MAHPSRVLDHLHIFLSKLVRVEFEEPLGYFRQGGELGFFVDVLLTVLILKEALGNEMTENELFRK